MDTKHGGSPLLGLVPAGLENLPKLEGSSVLVEAPSVGAGRRDAAANAERAKQFERRRLADGYLREMLGVHPPIPGPAMADTSSEDVALALKYADEMIKQTGGHV